MDIVYEPLGYIGLERPKKGLLILKEGGFDQLLLNMAMACPAGELENFGKAETETDSKKAKKRKRNKISEHPEELSERFQLLLEQCREEGIIAPIARAPYLHRNTERRDLGDLLKRLIEESIKVCGQAGCRYLIVSPLFSGIKQGCEWETNRKYFLELADTAKENNVMLLLENQYREKNGNLIRGICSDAVEAVLWIDSLNAACGEERFGFCMDVGVCSLCRLNMREFATRLGSRIKAVVFRDCDGIH